MATIGLEGVHMRGPHGFYIEEQKLESDFIIDLYVETHTGMAAARDDLYSTVNYETLYLIIQAEMRKPTQLIEALAQRIMDRVQEQFSQLGGIKVRLRKLNPPLGGRVEAAVIELSSGSFGGGGGGGGGGFMGGGGLMEGDDDDGDMGGFDF